jgi:hypothetical protein
VNSASCVAVGVVLLAVMPVTGRAQTTEPPLRRFELAVGIGFLGGASLGDADADLRSGTPPDPYRLFGTSSRVLGTTALDLRAGFDLSPRIGFEAHALFGHPEVRTTVEGDVEGAPTIEVVERLDHYLIDGGIVVRLDELRVKGIRPFATAGGGYLRQLHEGLTVIEEGQVFYFGAGARYWIFARSRGVPRAGGLRADFRWNILTGDVVVDERTRQQPSISASFFLLF